MNPVAKIAITGANIAAAALASKDLGAAWKHVTGNEPPTTDPESKNTISVYAASQGHEVP